MTDAGRAPTGRPTATSGQPAAKPATKPATQPFMEQLTTALPGVGEKLAAKLTKAGIDTVGDLLYYLPRTYDNFEVVDAINTLRPGKVVVRGRVISVHTAHAKSRKLTITEALITDGTGELTAVWFNQPFRQQQFRDHPGDYYFEGEFAFSRGRYQLQTPKVTKADGMVAVAPAAAGASDGGAGAGSATAEANPATDTAAAQASPAPVTQVTGDQIVPVYPAKGTLTSDFFRRLLQRLRPEIARVPDLLPLNATKPQFVTAGGRAEALFQAHFPASQADVAAARAYLGYEEVFELVLAARLSQLENHKLKSQPLPFTQASTQKLVKSLPFQLTKGQRVAAWEILQDLGRNRPMNRLLQGDVGSGKTMVAALAAYQAVQHGAQVALLAPTAILATQHAANLDQILAPLGVRTALLLGATRNKPALKRRIAAGEIDLVIGTHALLTDSTHFTNLGLAIIDEQHRFGVQQRQKLLLKSPPGLAPHLLSMTATPIPRSLQLSIFGDLDISTITELPKGRQPVTTKLLSEINLRADLYPEVRATLGAGHQVYWICRHIEDSAAAETAGVKSQATKLQGLLPEAKVEFLHGRLDAAAKDDIMNRFSQGQIDILVSTTVVEVGVDVPNATLMVVMDADNYGLAQLHQLRGRVGRGQAPGTCYLVSAGEGRPSRRLQEMRKSTDGFHLAEVDLRLRGPGEIYGSLQHGALDLRIATLSDTKTIAAASRQVREFLKEPEALQQYPELGRRVHKYQQMTVLN